MRHTIEAGSSDISQVRGKLMKKTILVSLILILALSLFTACENGRTPQDGATRTVTASAGRVVKIPLPVERIVPLGNAPRMIT